MITIIPVRQLELTYRVLSIVPVRLLELTYQVLSNLIFEAQGTWSFHFKYPALATLIFKVPLI